MLTVDALSDNLSDAPTAADAAVALQLQGPGVPGTRVLAVSGLHPDWLARRAAWVGAYPMGVDIVLAAPDAMAALPRTTRIVVAPHGKET